MADAPIAALTDLKNFLKRLPLAGKRLRKWIRAVDWAISLFNVTADVGAVRSVACQDVDSVDAEDDQ